MNLGGDQVFLIQ